MKKILRQSITFIIFATASMTYFRATMEELPETEADRYWYCILCLTILAGFCESIEIYDHLVPLHTNEPYSLEEGQQSLVEIKPAQTLMKTATGLVILAPPLIMCGWAHLLQGHLLAKALGVENDVLLGALFALPALAKFSLISIPHLVHTYNGTREQYSLSVTNNELKKTPQNTWPSLKWWVMLALMVYLHLPEGELIANPIRQNLLRQLAVYGFSLAESIPHINQLEQLPGNMTQMLVNSNFTALLLALGIGSVAGIAHASQSLLAVIAANKDSRIAWLGPVFEFSIGFAEAQQHAVPALRKLNSFSFFGRGSPSTSTETNESDLNHDMRISH